MEIREVSDQELRDEWSRRFHLPKGTRLKSAAQASDHLRLFYKDEAKDRELFVMIYLSAQNSVLYTEVLFEGTVNTAAIYPRELVKRILIDHPGTTGVIISHNHPSGEITPSGSDRAITKKIKSALESIDVELLDHVILGQDYFSFADNKLL
ncbi:MAG: DNA repair protein [Candidatus Marinimicrobia bacterium]|nr:DNA repair protein [Candidatus Neomarinimicrobiota bacterium]